MARRALHEWLEVMPSDQILWGTDGNHAEGIYGDDAGPRRTSRAATPRSGLVKSTPPGAIETLDACMIAGKPFKAVIPGSTRPRQVAAWIVEQDVRTLNVAGNRERRSPGIGARVERFLADVFRQFQETEGEAPCAESP
jgi:putative molybdenum carrier protein